MRRLALLLSFLILPACANSLDDRELECMPDEPVAVDPAGEYYQFVVDTIDFPETSSEAETLGFDLDCEPSGRPDNALGQVIATIARLDEDGYDLDYEGKLLIDAGEILHLIQVQTTSLEGALDVGVVVLHGEDLDGDPADNFSGTESFGIDEQRGLGRLSGRVLDETLSAEYGSLPVAVTFPGLDDVFVLRLVGARIDADFDGEGLVGRIGGAVPQREIDTVIIPVFQEGLSRIVDRDCDEQGCVSSSFGQALLNLFDEDADGAISIPELRDNDLVSSLLSPDVDLFDQDGNFAPRTDGVKDGLSLALGFTAVGASFPVQ